MPTWTSTLLTSPPVIHVPAITTDVAGYFTNAFRPDTLSTSDFDFPVSELNLVERFKPIDQIILDPVEVEPDTGFALFTQNEIRFGDEDRVKLITPSQWPFSPICRLILDYDAGSGSGTGTLISENLILTAGHNIYQQKYGGWAKSVRAIPGCESAACPFGVTPASMLCVLEPWTTKEQHFPGSPYDLGLIVLSERIGKNAGYAGLRAFLDDSTLVGQNVIVSGYPGDIGNGQEHYGHRGSVTNVSKQRFEYLNDTGKGQSGSPVYRLETPADANLERMPLVLGSHTTGFSQRNSAMRVTTEILTSLSELTS
jgi:V8-like Glu-specific endopeptidase